LARKQVNVKFFERESLKTVGFHIQTLRGVAGAKPLIIFSAGTCEQEIL